MEIFWYPRTRKYTPKLPLYSFTYDPHKTPNGAFTANFKKGKDTFLNEDFQVEIEGRFFGLPVHSLEHALSAGVVKERNQRIYKLIEKAGV